MSVEVRATVACVPVVQRSQSIGTAFLVLHFILLHWWRGMRDNHTWISVFYPSRDTGLCV